MRKTQFIATIVLGTSLAFGTLSCNKDAIEDLQSDVAGLIVADGQLSAALVEANIALADATALLEAAIAENAVLTAENAALIAANMTEVDAQLSFRSSHLMN